jgi:Domain of unknown function (DUF4265)
MIDLVVGGEYPIIEFPADEVASSVPVAYVGPNRLFLEGVPFMVESASIGDVIEVSVIGEGRFRFERVVEAGGWRTYSYLLGPERLASPEAESLFAALDEIGVHWEHSFSGALFICVPPEMKFKPHRWVCARWPKESRRRD